MKYILITATALSAAGVHAKAQGQMPGLNNAINQLNQVLNNAFGANYPPPQGPGSGATVIINNGGNNGAKTTVPPSKPTNFMTVTKPGPPQSQPTTVNQAWTTSAASEMVPIPSPSPSADADLITACYPDPAMDPLDLNIYTIERLEWQVREMYSADPPLANLTDAPWWDMTINLVHALGKTDASGLSYATIQVRFMLGQGQYGYVDFNSTEEMDGFQWPTYTTYDPLYGYVNDIEDFLDSHVSVDFIDALDIARVQTGLIPFREIILFTPFLSAEECASSPYVGDLLYYVAFGSGNGSFVSASVDEEARLTCLNTE